MTLTLRIFGYLLCVVGLAALISVAAKFRRTLNEAEKAAIDTEVRLINQKLDEAQVRQDVRRELIDAYSTTMTIREKMANISFGRAFAPCSPWCVLE